MAPSTITITGVPGYDGEYPLDIDEQFFTNQELRDIKLLTGLRGGELMEAIEAGDNDVVVAFAVTAIRRSGKVIHPDVLWNAAAGGILFNTGEEAEGEESLPPTDEPSSNDASSGTSSDPPTDQSPPSPLATGSPVSDTGAALVSGT